MVKEKDKVSDNDFTDDDFNDDDVAPAFSDDVASVETAKVGQSAAGLENVQGFLTRYGYLDDGSFMPGHLDEATSTAVRTYQEFFGLNVTGDFDEATRRQMMHPRCAVPHIRRVPRAEFVTTCAWNDRNLKVVWSQRTDRSRGQAAMRALATWARVVPLTFTFEAWGTAGRADKTADLKIAWTLRRHFDQDVPPGITRPFDFGSRGVGHAESPPPCNTSLPPGMSFKPTPIHFNDEDFEWSDRGLPNDDEIDAESAALHEVGHAIGLEHSAIRTAVMWPELEKGATKRNLTADDIAGAQSLYGAGSGRVVFPT